MKGEMYYRGLLVMLLVIAFSLIFQGCGAGDAGKSEQTPSINELLLWNKLGSDEECLNSMVGAALIGGSGTKTFGAGKYDNGIKVLSSNLRENTYCVPENTIPGDNFTIEFWYTRTIEINAEDMFIILDGTDVAESYNKRIDIGIGDWQGSWGYVIFFGLRLNTSNTKEISIYHDYSTLDDLRNAFPLNTPVHIAISKQNSDGAMRIYLNGQELSFSHRISEPYVTDDHSYVANKSGFFAPKLYLGYHSFSSSSGLAANGIIDNIKIWNTVKTDFSDRLSE